MISDSCRPLRADDHQIHRPREAATEQAEALPHPPLDAVPNHRVPYASAHHEPKPRSTGCRCRGVVEDQGACDDPGAVVQGVTELVPPPQAEARREPDYFLGIWTDSDFRPLRRRALMIARPADVAMRERNPCLRLRFTLCG